MARDAPVLPAMRAILVIGAVLTFGAGVPLFLLSARTDRWFAWTIQPPVAAAAIGSFYFGASLLAGWNARRDNWQKARMGLASVQVFLWATCIATLMHLSAFNLDSDVLTARVAAWIWVVVYLVEPPLFTAIYGYQVRAARQGPIAAAGDGRLPKVLRVLFVSVGAATAAVGAILVVAPQTGDGLWPWELTPLVARTTGAWLLAYGGVQIETAIDAIPANIRPVLWAQALIGALLLIAIVQRLEDVRLVSAAGASVVAWCLLALALAIWGLLGTRSTERPTGARGGSPTIPPPPPSGHPKGTAT